MKYEKKGKNHILNLEGQKEMDRQIEQLLKDHIIEPSIENTWCCPAFLVRKKGITPGSPIKYRLV